MGYRYFINGREVDVTQRYSGSVTIRLRNENIATFYAKDVNELKKLADKYLAEKLDAILSREDFYQVSYHISFGMMPEHRYTRDEVYPNDVPTPH